MTSRLMDFLVDLDFYGQPITINYKGSDSYKTKFGSFCSLCTYALILFNLLSLLRGFTDGSKQSEATQLTNFDRFEAGQFNFDEQQL
jgi:hypothetical protein